jgi:endonuclease YncB( thermonuclease family)
MGCVQSTYKDPSTPVAKQLRKVDKDQIPTVFHQNQEIYARIIKVYDGDTCTALVVVGTQPIKIRLRLAHIDTPEMRDDPTHTRSVAEKRLAIAARDRLADLILEKIVPIKILKWDKYGGRVVTEIYVTVNGRKTTASQILLDEGYAQPYEGGRKAEWTL